MKQLHTIAETCQMFMEHVYPNVQLSEIQKEEIRRAYYAGALYSWEILNAASNTMREDVAMKMFGDFQAELQKFGETIKPHRLGENPDGTGS